MERFAQTLTFIGALGSGILGGLFFIFSVCIMASFAKLTPANGISAMSAINVTILNGWFLTVFMGTTLLCAALIVGWFLSWFPAGGPLVALGSATLIIGMFGVTMFFNVPMNGTLASMNPDSAEGVALWQDFLVRWTLWNHVRTVASILSSALFILALWK